MDDYIDLLVTTVSEFPGNFTWYLCFLGLDFLTYGFWLMCVGCHCWVVVGCKYFIFTTNVFITCFAHTTTIACLKLSKNPYIVTPISALSSCLQTIFISSSLHQCPSVIKDRHPFNGLFSRTTSASTRQVKRVWILNWNKRRYGGNGISWIIYKSFAPRSREITGVQPLKACIFNTFWIWI